MIVMNIISKLLRKNKLNVERPLPDDYLTQDEVDSDFSIFGADMPYTEVRWYDYWDGKCVLFFKTLYSEWFEAGYVTPKDDGGFIVETIPHKTYLRESINGKKTECQISFRLDTTDRTNNYYEICHKKITMLGVKWVPYRIVEGFFTSRVRTNIYT